MQELATREVKSIKSQLISKFPSRFQVSGINAARATLPEPQGGLAVPQLEGGKVCMDLDCGMGTPQFSMYLEVSGLIFIPSFDLQILS